MPVLGHKESDPSRKIDPYGVDMDEIRRRIVATSIDPVQPEEDEEMIVPIEVAAGESKSFHVEPRSPDGRASFLGVKDALVVLSSHSADPVPVWIWGQGPTPNKDVHVGRHPLAFHADGGWLHIHNRGTAEIGGSILYRR